MVGGGESATEIEPDWPSGRLRSPDRRGFDSSLRFSFLFKKKKKKKKKKKSGLGTLSCDFAPHNE